MEFHDQYNIEIERPWRVRFRNSENEEISPGSMNVFTNTPILDISIVRKGGRWEMIHEHTHYGHFNRWLGSPTQEFMDQVTDVKEGRERFIDMAESYGFETLTYEEELGELNSLDFPQAYAASNHS